MDKGSQSGESAQLLLSPYEVARRMSVSRSTVYELMAKGELASISIGRARRIPASALDEWFEDHIEEQRLRMMEPPC